MTALTVQRAIWVLLAYFKVTVSRSPDPLDPSSIPRSSIPASLSGVRSELRLGRETGHQILYGIALHDYLERRHTEAVVGENAFQRSSEAEVRQG